MSVLRRAWGGWAPYLLSVLRIVAAASYITHGTTKMLAWPASILPNGGTLGINSLAGVGGVLELVLGPLLLLGLFTRPVAFLISGEMAVAFFKANLPRGMYPILNGGEVAVIYCFLFLYLSAAGPGPISLDAMRSKEST